MSTSTLLSNQTKYMLIYAYCYVIAIDVSSMDQRGFFVSFVYFYV